MSGRGVGRGRGEKGIGIMLEEKEGAGE